MSAETLAVDELASETVGRSENKPIKEYRKHRMVSKKTNSESCYCTQGKRVSSMGEGSTALDAVVDAVMCCPDPTSGIKMYFKRLL